MKKNRKGTLVAILLFSTVILTACGSKVTEDTTKLSGGTKTSGEQLFRVVVQQEMPSADLSLVANSISFSAFNNIYEGLYRLDENSNPQAAGASELATVSEDGLTYVFTLRDNAKWSNGEPVVADDYVYGWQRTANPKTASEYAYLYELVKNGADVTAGKKNVEELGIKGLDDHTLEVTLEKPTPYFDYLLAFPTFFPQNKKVVDEYGEEYATISETSVYNGPFTLTDFEGSGTDIAWSYTKNDQYWDKEIVQLDKIEVSVVKDTSTALNLFQDGQQDDIILSGELANQMADDPQFVVIKEATTSYIDFNKHTEGSPFKNQNFRKAISYSIDREAIVTNILGDGSVVSTGLVPEGMSFSPEDKTDFAKENENILTYDQEKARDYWEIAKKELGVDSVTFDIVGSDIDSTKKILEYLQGTIKDTLKDVDVTITTVPFSVRLDREKKGTFDAVMSGWSSDYADPSSFLEVFVTGNSYNRGGYSNKAYDALVKDASSTNVLNLDKRWTDMVEAEKILMDEMGVVPVYQKAEAHLRNEKIKGVVAHGAGATYDYKWTYVSEE